MARVPIYTRKVPPFPPDLSFLLAVFPKVVYRRKFKPIKCSPFFLGLDKYVCQSLFCRTRDNVIRRRWPTSLVMEAPETGEVVTDFVRHFSAS